ncbi:GNAT family N-acetyltransferase [Kurthia senegalensis]|uniref:GNAT family N-acetyltransferase n=1 Tax=Kurthia senegalensis TaxID=1033740 RepID=UPI000289D7D2|nr:GNAT family N-acetyltransferase [Kurthia senegalensis]
MEKLLIQLQKLGVHSIKNNKSIMLEVLKYNKSHVMEIDRLLNELINEMQNSTWNKILLECPRQLLNNLRYTKTNMNITGERVVYTMELLDSDDFSVPKFEVWPINQENSIRLLSEVLQVTLNHAEVFLQQMKEELPDQAEKMFTVYKVNTIPVGIVLPHIEPLTNNEGRLFWIGIHPNYLGKGFGKDLHAIGLYRLKKDFHAECYVGITQIDNCAMRKIMQSNGCVESEHILASLEYVHDSTLKKSDCMDI